ncbi:MAG: FGGY-family carbohydrate kinase [Eubacteriales bacterium]|nr:FGGY-family carbohydrate kinase [Eubacteriales bacterium]
MDTILILDIGTSNIRGVLFNEEGEIVYRTSIKNIPDYLSKIRVEQKPEKYREKIVQVTEKCVAYAKSNAYTISCISTTALRTCVMLVKEDGTPVSDIIMWQDKRAEEICLELRESEELVYQCTGTRIHPVFVGPKILWMKKYWPEAYADSDRIVTVADDIHHMITGKWVTDYTYGSRTSLMNIKTLKWDPQMLKLFGVREEMLCELVEQGSIIGTVQESFAEKTGLKCGIPVVSAGGDQNCGALGSGVVGEGLAQLTTGSGAYLIVCSDSPKLDKNKRFLCNMAAVKGKYIVEASMLSSAILYEWFYDNFYTESQGDMTSTINAEAEKSRPGAGGMIVLPYFQGRGCPDWNTRATGSFLNVTMHNSRGDFARALLEGIAMESAENLEIIEEYTGTLDKIYLGGGMTKSSLFNQIQADTANRTFSLNKNEETTALGAFISAAAATGLVSSCQEGRKFIRGTQCVYRPNSENQKYYQEIRCERQRLYQALYQQELGAERADK